MEGIMKIKFQIIIELEDTENPIVEEFAWVDANGSNARVITRSDDNVEKVKQFAGKKLTVIQTREWVRVAFTDNTQGATV